MADIRERVSKFLERRPDITVAQLASHTKFAPTTCRDFINGHRSSPSAEVEAEFERVLRLAESGEILALPGVVTITEQHTQRVRRVARRRDFYEIETVRRVSQVLNYCAEQATIGVITGDYGIGKTEAVQHWQQREGRNVESVLYEFHEFTSANSVEFMACLAELLNVSATRGSQTGGRTFRAVCDKLNESPSLLILDQCETVRPRVMQVIRQIWDRTHQAGVGVVLLASPVLMERMQASRMRDLGALTSRVGIWAPLQGLSRGEMAAIVKQEGVTDLDEAAFDLWWKATAGSMRRLVRSLDLIKAKHQGKRVTEKTISGVAAHLWGMTVEAA